jgi:hypothetical protein
VSELGVVVKIVGGRVQLGGMVATPDRRLLVEEIVRQLLPEHEVQNDITVHELSPAPRQERLR